MTGSLKHMATTRPRLTRLCCGALTLAACGMFGCSQTLRVEQADAGEKVGGDAFLHEHLAKTSAVTVAEAYRAMLFLADGDDKHADFDARRAELESRKIARPEWGLSREACIDKGSVAYMICQIIKLQGGVNFNVFGRLTGLGDRRYAVRELAYLEIMPPASPHRYITGGELVDAISKADRYMADHGMYPQESTDIKEMLDSGAPASRPAK